MSSTNSDTLDSILGFFNPSRSNQYLYVATEHTTAIPPAIPGDGFNRLSTIFTQNAIRSATYGNTNQFYPLDINSIKGLKVVGTYERRNFDGKICKFDKVELPPGLGNSREPKWC